jgi:3'-phosphoadenosine 5'-phosphosulfate sulfotransferase (PAPS reductase)/FAD synthetase
LKRGPIQKGVLAYANEHDFSIIVDAAGIRSQESSARARQPIWSLEESKSLLARVSRGKQVPPSRLWVRYAPIHALSRTEVFAVIAAAGQRPHPAYVMGNERLSCKFCIMGSKPDLRNAAEHDPDLYADYLAAEETTGWKFQDGRSLRDLVGITVAEARSRKRTLPVLSGEFRPSMIPSERSFSRETPEAFPCGGSEDEWAPEDDETGDVKVRENGRSEHVCARHAHLLGRR